MKTVTDFLKDKFQTDDCMLLEKLIEEEIIRNRLSVDSTPLFWKSSICYEMVMRNILTVPYDSMEINGAAHAYAEKNREIYVEVSNITDKISMWCFDFALPMYSYQNILELQDRYEKDTRPGRHLYERGEVNWNEWLPSPVPASYKTDSRFARIENKNNALVAEFERAEETGVVMRDDLGNWNIMVTDAFDADIFLVADSYEKGGGADNDGLDALIARLETEEERQKNSARPVGIGSLKASPGSERQVMLDFYLKSPVLNRKLHDEMEKREAMAKRIAELRTLRDGNIIFAEEQKDFFNAIFTGVLFYGNEIAYTYDELGEEKVVELQNNDMPLGDTGTYQAFLNFKSMDADIKKKIIAETKNRLKEEDSPEVIAAVEKLDANMPKRIARCSMLHDETDPLHEELERFYEEFMKALREFAST